MQSYFTGVAVRGPAHIDEHIDWLVDSIDQFTPTEAGLTIIGIAGALFHVGVTEGSREPIAGMFALLLRKATVASLREVLQSGFRAYVSICLSYVLLWPSADINEATLQEMREIVAELVPAFDKPELFQNNQIAVIVRAFAGSFDPKFVENMRAILLGDDHGARVWLLAKFLIRTNAGATRFELDVATSLFSQSDIERSLTETARGGASSNARPIFVAFHAALAERGAQP
jgi:hypothetical protein